jgi:hypothetical protein
LLQGPVTFTWSRAYDAWDGAKDRPPIRFGIQIDNTSTFKSPEVDKQDIDPGTDNLQVDNLIGGVVYWRVRAVYDIGTTDWSEIKMFRHAVAPILVKNIPTVKIDENTDAVNKLDLNNYFTDSLWPTKLIYTVASQGAPDKVLVNITDGHFISVYTKDKQNFWYGASWAIIMATNKATPALSNVSNKFVVTVTHVNQAPFITAIPDQKVDEDVSTVLDLAPYVRDVDNPNGQLTVTTDSPFITVSGLNLTMNMGYIKATDGLIHVNITVADLQLTSYGSFNVSVKFINDAPTIKKITDRTMEENTDLSFTLIPYGKDEEDLAKDLRWTAVGGSLVKANVSTEGIITLTPKKDEFGNDTITLTVTDTMGASATTSVKVLVLHVNQAPRFGAVEDMTVMAGTPKQKNLEQYISDVDNLKSELVLTSDSKYVASIVGFTVTIQYPLDTPLDTDTITFTVSDGIDSTGAKMKVIVQRPPRFINTIPEIAVTQGQTSPTIMLDYMATNNNGDNSQLVWTVMNKGDKSLTTATIKNKNQLVVSGGTSKTGTTTLRVTCTDNLGLTAYQDVKVTVKEAPGGIGVGATSDNLMIPFLLIVVLIAMVGVTIGYKMKLNSDRIRRIRAARQARLKRLEAKVQTKEGVSLTGTSLAESPDKLESAQTGPSSQQLAHLSRIAPLCFACGTKTRPDEHGRFLCPKCGRVSR